MNNKVFGYIYYSSTALLLLDMLSAELLVSTGLKVRVLIPVDQGTIHRYSSFLDSHPYTDGNFEYPSGRGRRPGPYQIE